MPPEKEYDFNRARSTADVDLTKADVACQKCKGTGYTGRTFEPDEEMQIAGICDPIPEICRCVEDNKGVVPASSPLERAHKASVASGEWARIQARDIIRNCPPWRQLILARKFEIDAESMTDAATADAYRETARLLRGENSATLH